MANMATMPIYGKNKNLQKRWINFNETWHRAFIANVLQCVYKT